MSAYTSTTSITIDWLLVIVIKVSYMITTYSNDAEFSTDKQYVKIKRYRKIDPDYNIQ